MTNPPVPDAGAALPAMPAVVHKPYVPEVPAPVFDDMALLSVSTFLVNLKIFYDFLLRKNMRSKDAIDHICVVCLKLPTAFRWAQTTTFSGTWEDFVAKFRAKWVSSTEKERAGHRMLYQVWQNSSSIRQYANTFYEAVQCCDLVGFAYTTDVLQAAFMRGLHKTYSDLLARSGLDVQSVEQCEDYLARAEVRGAIGPSNGSQPRTNSKGSNRNFGRQHNSNNNSSNNHSNANANNMNNNNNSSNNNNNMNGGAGRGSGNNNYNNGSNSSSSAGRNSFGGSGGGRGNGNWRRNGQPRDESDLVSNK